MQLSRSSTCGAFVWPLTSAGSWRSSSIRCNQERRISVASAPSASCANYYYFFNFSREQSVPRWSRKFSARAGERKSTARKPASRSPAASRLARALNAGQQSVVTPSTSCHFNAAYLSGSTLDGRIEAHRSGTMRHCEIALNGRRRSSGAARNLVFAAASVDRTAKQSQSQTADAARSRSGRLAAPSKPLG